MASPRQDGDFNQLSNMEYGKLIDYDIALKKANNVADNEKIFSDAFYKYDSKKTMLPFKESAFQMGKSDAIRDVIYPAAGYPVDYKSEDLISKSGNAPSIKIMSSSKYSQIKTLSRIILDSLTVKGFDLFVNGLPGLTAYSGLSYIVDSAYSHSTSRENHLTNNDTHYGNNTYYDDHISTADDAWGINYKPKTLAGLAVGCVAVACSYAITKFLTLPIKKYAITKINDLTNIQPINQARRRAQIPGKTPDVAEVVSPQGVFGTTLIGVKDIAFPSAVGVATTSISEFSSLKHPIAIAGVTSATLSLGYGILDHYFSKTNYYEDPYKLTYNIEDLRQMDPAGKNIKIYQDEEGNFVRPYETGYRRKDYLPTQVGEASDASFTNYQARVQLAPGFDEPRFAFSDWDPQPDKMDIKVHPVDRRAVDAFQFKHEDNVLEQSIIANQNPDAMIHRQVQLNPERSWGNHRRQPLYKLEFDERGELFFAKTKHTIDGYGGIRYNERDPVGALNEDFILRPTEKLAEDYHKIDNIIIALEGGIRRSVGLAATGGLDVSHITNFGAKAAGAAFKNAIINVNDRPLINRLLSNKDYYLHKVRDLMANINNKFLILYDNQDQQEDLVGHVVGVVEDTSSGPSSSEYP